MAWETILPLIYTTNWQSIQYTIDYKELPLQRYHWLLGEGFHPIYPDSEYFKEDKNLFSGYNL